MLKACYAIRGGPRTRHYSLVRRVSIDGER
jgi:hypothetical protein